MAARVSSWRVEPFFAHCNSEADMPPQHIQTSAPGHDGGTRSLFSSHVSEVPSEGSYAGEE